MSMPKVIITGGMRCTQSVWALSEGFKRAGCETHYVRTTHRVDDRKEGKPQAVGEMAALVDAGASLIVWWQPQNDLNIVVDAITRVKAAARKQGRDVRCVMQCIDDPLLVYTRPLLGRHGIAPLSYFDLCVTCCADSMPWYEERGVRAIVGYPAADDVLHGQAKPSPERACDISFVATNSYPREEFPDTLATRKEMLGAVADLGTLNLYGYWREKRLGWYSCGEGYKRAYKGWVHYDKDVPTIYASSRINLNSHVRPDGYRYLNDRAITCMASGGFMLCDRVAGIEEIFTDGEHCALWGSLEELRAKATYYLAHEDERAAIAAAGRRKVLAEFTGEKLALDIIAACRE